MRAKRTGNNQTEIVKALRKMGYSVFITSMVGYGFPDIIVGAHKMNYLFEIKDGNKPKSQQKLTYLENTFHLTWQGTVHIITSIEQAIDIINPH
jgi:Holliday junction resolvase